MTPQEFKAWFDGFTEAFTGVPTKAQWSRVKERVGEIDGKPVTERIFVDRYYPLYQRHWDYRPYWSTYSANAVGLNTTTLNCSTHAVGMTSNAVNQYRQATAFDSVGAMADLGRADAKALAA